MNSQGMPFTIAVQMALYLKNTNPAFMGRVPTFTTARQRTWAKKTKAEKRKTFTSGLRGWYGRVKVSPL